ncbi:MAG TPA: AraC family ligand binding domain-containing protein [Tepidisphaeraceae bacterium]|nr:AraC family ligand binding domain-containing protein [Tepidisphaeraceae bacterium]
MPDPTADRLRPHPDGRFAALQHEFNLDEVAARLNAEVEAGEAGHRQEMLYKHGPTSVTLFVFGHLTRLPPHRTKGVVTIQVLKGHLQVTAESQSHNLHAGHLLILAAGVQHDVVAREESWMLLTVNLETTAVPGKA